MNHRQTSIPASAFDLSIWSNPGEGRHDRQFAGSGRVKFTRSCKPVDFGPPYSANTKTKQGWGRSPELAHGFGFGALWLADKQLFGCGVFPQAKRNTSPNPINATSRSLRANGTTPPHPSKAKPAPKPKPPARLHFNHPSKKF